MVTSGKVTMNPIRSTNHHTWMSYLIQPCLDNTPLFAAYLWLNEESPYRFSIHNIEFNPHKSDDPEKSKATTLRLLYDRARGLSPAESNEQYGLEEKNLRSNIRRIKRAPRDK